MSRARLVAGLLALTVLTPAALCPAAPDDHKAEKELARREKELGPNGLKLATERAVIFKDGHGLVVKTATGVADADGQVVTDEVPEAAILGTFWAFSEGHELRAMTAGWHEETRTESVENACTTPLDLLRANPNHTVTLELEKAEVTGRIIEVLEAPPEERAHLDA